MTKYRYGVELYSVKDELAKDMPATLKRVKAMGYEGVEFFGEFIHPAEEVKKALDEAGLVCCGWHTPWTYMRDDKFTSTVSYFKTIGNKYVIIPGLPGEMTINEDAWLNNAKWFNELAAKLSVHGMQIGYHNHAGELHLYEGTNKCPFTVFFDHTNNSVIVQMDNGHVLNGRGMDMLDLIRRYPGRYTSVHLKPYSLQAGAFDHNKGYATMIGEDDVPWSEFMTLCRKIGGTEWFIVEYECSELYPELDGVEKCLFTLMEMEARGEF